MKTLKLLFCLLFLTSASIVFANAEYDKRQQVKALVEQGVATALAQGKEALIKQVNDSKGVFAQGDLYLFVGALDKVTILAHPYHPELVGKNLSLFNDKNGQYMSFEFVRTALEQGAGWVSYQWQKLNKETTTKHTYVMKIPTKKYFVGAGYYE
ncbi:ABC-type amino acid transport, signal transduction systems, periplasmic component/domain [uncultured Candidatus Thioglobus sp.]|nr:ABC-type amino acid transport, signal transduction systems, periplasmic component/domain [uncultured Candidatus Thioglobus sp.]